MSAAIFYAGKGADVTPHDSNDNTFDCLFIGTGGDVAVRCQKDSSGSTVFKNVASGSFLPVRTSLVLATDTTATDIRGLTLAG